MAPIADRFELHIEDSALRDLRDRLARVRYPDEAPASRWAYGTSVDFMRELVVYWRDRYDWRATEKALNALPQFKTRIEGIDVHFIHVAGRGPTPMPLLLSHGWPGSVLEFMKLIPLLTDPAAHGGDPADAFTVVAPSLPGYTLSFMPNQRRFALPEIGAMFDTLMLRLGYGRYAAQGGDWGSFVTAWLAEKYRAWTDCDGDPRNALTMDEMLGNISLYWFTNCIGASFWPYYARMHGPWPIDGRIDVPTGYAEFPREILRPPRVSAERVFDIRRWTVMPKGGHFAALEQPRALAEEIRSFFRDLR
jgi:pimeloyl-ACP methyl ester carboxylesterase